MASRARGKGAAAGSAAAKRKRDEEPDCIVVEDDGPDAAASPRKGGGRKRTGGAGAPPLSLKELLSRLDELQSGVEAGETKSGKRAGGKAKKGAKAVPQHGWSKGTGFGGSHEMSQKESEGQQRARAREEELDAAVTAVFQQIVITLEREQSPQSNLCFQLQSCAGLGWGIYRLLSNQSMLDIGQRGTPFKNLLALLSFFARSDHRSDGKHIYAPLLITPLQRKGWAGVKQLAPEAGKDGASASSSKAAEPPRRSQRAAKAKEAAEGSKKAGELSEADLASMDTVLSLLSALKSQASMFVTLAKSSSAMGVSAPESKGGGGAAGKGGGKERKESKESAAMGGTDEETANALALNLYISDTADAVAKLVDACAKAGELTLRSTSGADGKDGNAGTIGGDDVGAGSKRGREGAAAGERGRGASRGVSSGKEACDEMSDKVQWSNADDEAYKRELGRERFKTIPLLEMVDEGKATFALDVNGPQFTAPPKPIWSGSSLSGSSLANLLSEIGSHGAGPAGWMVVGPGGLPALPPGLAQVVGQPGGAGAGAGASGGVGASGKGAGAAAAEGSSSSGSSGSGSKPAVQTVRGRMTRIASEVTSLSTNLPVEAGSSIFVRVDEDRPDVLKALIVGPEDTPYENGLFEFDILLPLTYPQSPPQVKLVTTGHGRVRFNPNLYADGKVCLSLLGTWTGPSWNATTSTLLQVLVSIQGLILVSEPYFNEPGFEGSLGTKQGTAASKQYNTSIRRHTLKVAIHDQLNNKKSVFRDVIVRHCLRKRAKLLAQCDVWEKEAKALEASKEKLSKHVDPLHDMALFGQVAPLLMPLPPAGLKSLATEHVHVQLMFSRPRL